jgi:RNA polymerase sigma-70 factor, ECF subfamily
MGPDSPLIARAAAGDAAAFAALVREHQSRVRAFLRRLTRGDTALADDLSQETFLEAFRKIAQYRGEGTFGGWLCGIAWSRFLMERRKRKEEPLDAPDEALGSDPRPAADARLDLEKAMARLSEPERAALTLCYALGHSHGEAAEILNLPLGTVKSHVLRGREKLAAMLGARP